MKNEITIDLDTLLDSNKTPLAQMLEQNGYAEVQNIFTFQRIYARRSDSLEVCALHKTDNSADYFRVPIHQEDALENYFRKRERGGDLTVVSLVGEIVLGLAAVAIIAVTGYQPPLGLAEGNPLFVAACFSLPTLGVLDETLGNYLRKSKALTGGYHSTGSQALRDALELSTFGHNHDPKAFI